MKLIFINLIIILLAFNISSREIGETEITTEDGIEVFQNDKYYLLKKNVKILSDNFILNADNVKINFDKNLYDITELNAKGNVSFNSSEFKMKGNGETLRLEVKVEKLKVKGIGSKLKTEDILMFSDGFIQINNITGDFFLEGPNSKLTNENIFIEAKKINGSFTNNTTGREITFLEVFDEDLSYIKNNDTEMYAKKINFDNNTAIIELIDNVTIIRGGEKITGDYGTLDTINNSYKIKSNNQTKVKAIIQNNE